MKKIVLASLMMVCLPYWAMSQSVDDDLYFILHYHCRTGGCVNGSRVLLLRNHHFHLLLNLLFLFSFFLRDEIKVVINAF